jgi:hypothetical protein
MQLVAEMNDTILVKTLKIVAVLTKIVPTKVIFLLMLVRP